MTLLRTLAVLGLSLTAQAETAGTLPKDAQNDPCDALHCDGDSFCLIDATGAAFCDKYQTVNHTQDPCAALKCDTDHFCNIDATGVAFCDKYQTVNHTQDPCAALKCDTDHFCNIDATGAAFCDKYQTVNHTQDPCAALKCDTDHFCNFDATGVAFCDKYQTVNHTQDPCAKIECQPDHFCNIDATGVAFCDKVETHRGASALQSGHVDVSRGVPAAEPAVALPTADASLSGVVVPLASALSLLCLGGLVAFLVIRNRVPETDEADIEMLA